MPKKAKSKKKKAFTLTEMLIVMLMLGLLFIVLIPKIVDVQDNARETQIKVRFKEFGDSAELALRENSGFTGMAKSKVPMNTNNKILNTLNEYMDDSNKFEYFNNSMSYSESKAKDPWGNPYSLIIEADVNKNTGKFTFVSYGKDGKKSRDFRRGKTEDMRDAFDYAYVIEYKDGIITRTFMGLDDILEAHGVSGSGRS